MMNHQRRQNHPVLQVFLSAGGDSVLHLLADGSILLVPRSLYGSLLSKSKPDYVASAARLCFWAIRIVILLGSVAPKLLRYLPSN
jgi:hypothetical protein